MITKDKLQNTKRDGHPGWETLNDFADGSLAEGTIGAVRIHVDGCAECKALVSRLRELLSLAVTARDVDAPPAAWTGIRKEIDRRKEIALHTVETTPVPPARPATRRTYLWLAAAAVVLVTLSSLTTIAVMRGRSVAIGELARTPEAMTTPNGGLTLPNDVAALERGYLVTVTDLSAALESSTSKLAPETVSTVRRSLAIIDSAIAEARDALLADPASGFLRGVLARNYQQKIDLLRRATERAAVT